MSNILGSTGIAILNPLEAIWIGFVGILPGLIAAIIVIIIGYILGLALGHLLTLILEKAGLERQVAKAQLTKTIGHTHLSAILGELLKWYVFIIFLQTAVELINLGGLSVILSNFVNWLPNLIVAIVVVLFGLVFANYIELKMILHSKVKGVKVSAAVIKWVIVLMVAIVALNQIGIDVSILENAFLIILASLGIGFALALGIGLGSALKKDGADIISSIKKNF